MAINVATFLFEIAMSIAAASASLTADSIDFLEDASLSILALTALSLPMRVRARLGALCALVLLIPTAGVLFALWRRAQAPAPPAASLIALTSVVAFAANLVCASLLAKHRARGGSLVRAAFLSARNDVAANVAVFAAGCLTALTRGSWPDIAAGLCIGLLNGGAAWEVWQAARSEGDDALPTA